MADVSDPDGDDPTPDEALSTLSRSEPLRDTLPAAARDND
jgi:hypothetical protein